MMLQVDDFIDITVTTFCATHEEVRAANTIVEIACQNTYQLNPTMYGDLYGFKGYEYLVQPFNDMWNKVVVIKRAQIGATDAIARRDAMFCMQFPGIKVVYTFPTEFDMKMYVRDRFDDLIRESPMLKSALIGNPDSVSIKKFDKSSVIFRGRSTERAAISIPANRITHDESDFSDQDIMETFRSRLGAAKLKLLPEQYDAIKKFEDYVNKKAQPIKPGVYFPLLSAEKVGEYYVIEGGLETRFSTPTIPGFGVSRIYYGTDLDDGSDQMELWVRHPKCGTWQKPVFNSESIEGFWEYGTQEPAGAKFYKCRGCGREFDFEEIGNWTRDSPMSYEHVAWVPRETGREWRGYKIPWYSGAFHKKARDLMLEYHGYKLKSRRDNFFLGEASIDANDALTLPIMHRLNKNGVAYEDCGDGVSEYVLGADQGVYYVIAKRIPYTETEVNKLGKIQIVKIGYSHNNDAFPSVEDGAIRDNGHLTREMNLFNVSISAIDNLPNETASKQFQDLHPGKVWRISSSGALKADITFDEESMSATESKVKALDKTVKFVMDGNVVLPKEDTPEAVEFKKHCCNMIKITREKVDSMGRPTGNIEVIYNKIGPEHFLHALKFLIEAMELTYYLPTVPRVAEPSIQSLEMKT